MKLLYRILFFLLAIFSTNFSEAKVLVFEAVVSETNIISNVAENKNESDEVLENDVGISCKSRSGLVDYRNWTKCIEGSAAKGGMNLMPEGKLANHLFKGAGKLADNPANRSLIQNLANSKALGVNAFGKSWHMGLDGAGKSIYTYTQNGVVKGAGYATMTAEQMILKYGLK